MESIKGVAREVMAVLDLYPKTRDSDDLLYYHVCKDRLLRKGIVLDQLSFKTVILGRKEYGIPPYETVRRTRQKIQSEYPELRSAADVEAMRMVREEEFKTYARGVGV